MVRIIDGMYITKAYLPFDVKPEYLDSIIVFPVNRLLPGVELLPFVNVFTTSVASPVRERIRTCM